MMQKRNKNGYGKGEEIRGRRKMEIVKGGSWRRNVAGGCEKRKNAMKRNKMEKENITKYKESSGED